MALSIKLHRQPRKTGNQKYDQPAQAKLPSLCRGCRHCFKSIHYHFPNKLIWWADALSDNRSSNSFLASAESPHQTLGQLVLMQTFTVLSKLKKVKFPLKALRLPSYCLMYSSNACSICIIHIAFKCNQHFINTTGFHGNTCVVIFELLFKG